MVLGKNDHAKAPRPELSWFTVNWNFGRLTLAFGDGHPVKKIAAVTVQKRAQIVKCSAQIEIANIDVPVLVWREQLHETSSFLRGRLPLAIEPLRVLLLMENPPFGMMRTQPSDNSSSMRGKTPARRGERLRLSLGRHELT